MPQPRTLGKRLSRISGTWSEYDRREARLRPEHAGRYPGITAGLWEPAAVLADRVVASGLLRGSAERWRARALPEAHFEFRGGEEKEEERPRREDR